MAWTVRNKINVNILTCADAGKMFSVIPPKSNGFTTDRPSLVMYLGVNPHDTNKNLFLIFTTKKSFSDSCLFYTIRGNEQLNNFFNVLMRNYGVPFSGVSSVWSTTLKGSTKITPLTKLDSKGNEILDEKGSFVDLRISSTDAKILLDAYFSLDISNVIIGKLIKNIIDQKYHASLQFGTDRNLLALQLQAATRLYENFPCHFNRNIIKYNYNLSGDLVSKEINLSEFNSQVAMWKTQTQ